MSAVSATVSFLLVLLCASAAAVEGNKYADEVSNTTMTALIVTVMVEFSRVMFFIWGWK